MKNEEGHLIINKDNEFLRDSIRYASAGCGRWKAKASKDSKGCSSIDNPFIIHLPENVSQLKDSDEKHILDAISHLERIDSERKKE